MITEAELAQMKADLWERLRVKEKRIVALEREVEELRDELIIAKAALNDYMAISAKALKKEGQHREELQAALLRISKLPEGNCPYCGNPIDDAVAIARAEPSILARDEIPTDAITRTLLQEERRRLYQSVDELRSALRVLVDAIKAATNVSYIEITQELDTATEKARAALGEIT